ncbi:MAG TPA: YbdK family carboxylate-amine ligase [Gaiellaceae bacterium]|nr:YbdK family carboxylate-amine ligase [Gaiellaceae bacterium]
MTLGVEEELMILDADTFEPVAASHLLVGELDAGTLKTELHASVVELTTPVCADVGEVVASLRALRQAAAARAAEHGLVVAAGGSHPTASLESLPVVQEERYLSMIRDIGWAARRQGVNGLHVHVGVPSTDECWERLDSVLGWLPAVLALSCNSPFVDGVETGMLSNRAAILAELPRGGAPPAFASFADWQAWVDRLAGLGVLADYTRLWWDARPHPRLGTLEIRIADQPTSLERVELVVRAVRDLVERVPSRTTPRGDYLQNRWAAARSGVDAQLIHPDGTRLATVAELLGFEPPPPEATLRRSAAELAAETLRF